MKSERTRWIVFAAGSVLVAAGLSWLIHSQRSLLQENRAKVQAFQAEIAKGRSLVMSTPDLEREVIVQRETDGQAFLRGVVLQGAPSEGGSSSVSAGGTRSGKSKDKKLIELENKKLDELQLLLETAKDKRLEVTGAGI